nr:hypothetical protein CFP56_11852 [Quercus suber]
MAARPNTNPSINFAAFLTHLQNAAPTTYTADFANENGAAYKTDVYIYPTNAGADWSRRRSHIHIMCSDPAANGGNRLTDFRPYDAHCTVRTYEGYYSFKKYKTQMGFPIGAGQYGLRGILTRPVFDAQGKYLHNAFQEVCRYLWEESGLPDTEKAKWSLDAYDEDPMIDYENHWRDMLDFFQATCDAQMGAGAWNLRNRMW